MIDRLTYIGAAEIFLDDGASLLRPLRDIKVSNLVVGAVITRQIRSLDESRWKPPIQKVIGHLLNDLLIVYASENPVLRSRALVWQLEHFYYIETANPSVQVNENIEEIRSLLKDKVGLNYAIEEKSFLFSSFRPASVMIPI